MDIENKSSESQTAINSIKKQIISAIYSVLLQANVTQMEEIHNVPISSVRGITPECRELRSAISVYSGDGNGRIRRIGSGVPCGQPWNLISLLFVSLLRRFNIEILI